MIVKWKQVSQDLVQTEWRGMLLQLERTSYGDWRLVVTASEGVLSVNDAASVITKERWATSKLAVDAVDAVMSRIVVSTVAVAQQRARSGERIVHRG